ncbi:MAG: hypothetical protein JWO31_3243, partial [Phycisphaerales bacterium]|nr:hypothetical protein [Phycisphaerales bacterium]
MGAASAPAAVDLDPAALVEWVDGAERPVAGKPGQPTPFQFQDGRIETPGLTFGESAVPGVRHLRVGFRAPVTVGTVLVRGGGRLSVLRPAVAYPGDPARDQDWLPAERLVGTGAGVTSRDPVGRDELAAWVLPPGTATRALRFSHVAAASDPRYGGWVGGAVVLPERLANVAPQAVASAAERDETAGLVNNAKAEQWDAWDNGKEGRAQPVTADRPERLTLTWPRPVPLAGLQAVWAGFGAAEVDAYAGPPDRHPRDAAEADWRPVGRFDGLRTGYPTAFRPNALTFDRLVTTR